MTLPKEDEKNVDEGIAGLMKSSLSATTLYRPVRVLGSGAYGRVSLCLNVQTGELCAVKQLIATKHFPSEAVKAAKQHEQRLAKLAIEAQILLGLEHPNIVKFQDYRDGHLAMEYVCGDNLSSIVHTLIEGIQTEHLVRVYIRQILSALEYAHGKNVVHRDLKPGNVLIDSKGNIKICDFGSSLLLDVMDPDSTPTSCITANYMAPEYHATTKALLSSKYDIWSVGCIMIFLLSGRDPWSEQKFHSPYALSSHIGEMEVIPTLPEKASPLAREFLLLCLTRNPRLRSSASELLRHEFLSKKLDAEFENEVERVRRNEQNEMESSDSDDPGADSGYDSMLSESE